MLNKTVHFRRPRKHSNPTPSWCISIQANRSSSHVMPHNMALGQYCLMLWRWSREITSRTLNPAEKRYSQLEKEGLAIVSGVHNFLYGRHFTIQSDHQPLSFLFNETKGIPQLASARIQRWALTLSTYNYTIRYKARKSLGNADALSRLPRPVTIIDDCIPADLEHLVHHLSST